MGSTMARSNGRGAKIHPIYEFDLNFALAQHALSSDVYIMTNNLPNPDL